MCPPCSRHSIDPGPGPPTACLAAGGGGPPPSSPSSTRRARATWCPGRAGPGRRWRGWRVGPPPSPASPSRQVRGRKQNQGFYNGMNLVFCKMIFNKCPVRHCRLPAAHVQVVEDRLSVRDTRHSVKLDTQTITTRRPGQILVSGELVSNTDNYNS